MNSITFDLDDYTIQLVNDRVLIWVGLPQHEPEVDLDISDLQQALSTASMLRREK